MSFEVLATVFIVAAIAIVAITPTKFGIWSTYWTHDQAGLILFKQNFHVFGIRWHKQWYGVKADNNRVGVWVRWLDAKGLPVSQKRAEWLTRLTRAAMK